MANNKKQGGARPGSGRKPAQISDEQRKQIQLLAGFGLNHQQISNVVDIPARTIQRHCTEELERGVDIANAAVVKSLFTNAISGKETSQIWWTKCRLRWREVVGHEHSGPGGGPIETKIEATAKLNMSRLTDQQIDLLIAATAPLLLPPPDAAKTNPPR